MYRIYDEYSLWDKKARVLENNFCPDIQDMNCMVGGIFDFRLNLYAIPDEKLDYINIFDFTYITVDQFHFYIKDIEFTKG